MEPNQPQYSIDYLNQIAPEEKKPGLGNKLFFGVLGGGLLLAIGVFFMIINGGGGAATQTSRLQTLSARLTTLQSITQSANSSITNNQLEAINSSLNLALVNASRAIEEPLINNKINAAKLPPEILAKEDGSALTTLLEDAQLNAVYDRTYAREMHYQATSLLSLMSEINNGTKSQSTKKFLEKTTKDITPINEQLGAFKDTV